MGEDGEELIAILDDVGEFGNNNYTKSHLVKFAKEFPKQQNTTELSDQHF